MNDSEQAAELYAQRSRGPITEAFCVVLERVEELSILGLLDEETLTASVLGGLSVAIPLMIELHGSGQERDRQCSWGPYSKSGRAGSRQSEATSGADFALVIWESDAWARLAIFQAKKGVVKFEEKVKSSGILKWSVDVHRLPRGSNPRIMGGRRNSQLATLLGTGGRGLAEHRRALSNGLETIDAAKGSMLNHTDNIAKLDWLHYLVYLDGQPVCVPLSAIDLATIEKELSNKPGRAYVEIKGDQDRTLFQLLRSGLEEEHPRGWLRLDKLGIAEIVGELVNLMTVFVCDEQSECPHTPDVAEGVKTRRVHALKARATTSSTPTSKL